MSCVFGSWRARRRSQGCHVQVKYRQITREETEITREETEITREKTEITREETEITREKTEVTREKTEITREKTEVTRVCCPRLSVPRLAQRVSVVALRGYRGGLASPESVRRSSSS
jgi:hypothetical protein